MQYIHTCALIKLMPCISPGVYIHTLRYIIVVSLKPMHPLWTVPFTRTISFKENLQNCGNNKRDQVVNVVCQVQVCTRVPQVESRDQRVLMGFDI